MEAEVVFRDVDKLNRLTEGDQTLEILMREFVVQFNRDCELSGWLAKGWVSVR